MIEVVKISTCWVIQITIIICFLTNYSQTSRKWTPSGPTVSVRLQEVQKRMHKRSQLQGVVRPNVSLIGKDMKFKDLRALLEQVHLSKTSLFYLKLQ